MKIIKKSNQPSKKPRKCPKNTPRAQEKPKYWRSAAQIEGLAHQFKEWCRRQSEDTKSEFMIAERFWITHDIHPKTPEEWCKKYPKFLRDYELGKAFLGCKKAEGAIVKRYDARSAQFLLHNYMPHWKEAEKYHADLKISDEEQSSGNKYIIIKDFPKDAPK